MWTKFKQLKVIITCYNIIIKLQMKTNNKILFENLNNIVYVLL